jgi:hypothetical protein
MRSPSLPLSSMSAFLGGSFVRSQEPISECPSFNKTALRELDKCQIRTTRPHPNGRGPSDRIAVEIFREKSEAYPNRTPEIGHAGTRNLGARGRR